MCVHLIGRWRLSGETRSLRLVEQGQVISTLRGETVPHRAEQERTKPATDKLLIRHRFTAVCLSLYPVIQETHSSS